MLIYLRTDAFDEALSVFVFLESKALRLWVLPFCLREHALVLPTCSSLVSLFAVDIYGKRNHFCK